MGREKLNFFESITQQDEAYIEVLAKTALIFSMYRHENGLTQAQLAKKLGVSQVMVSKLEKGDSNISLKNLSDYLFSLDMSFEISAQKITNRNVFLEMPSLISTLNKQKHYSYSNDTNNVADLILVA